MKNVPILSVLLLTTFLPLFTYAQCTGWPQIGMDLDGEAALDRYGFAVSLSGNGKRVASGGDKNDAGGTNAGHVRVSEWDGTDWIQMGDDIDGTSMNDEFGASASLNTDGSVLAVGAPSASIFPATATGYARIYDWTGTAWVQRGTDILGQAIGDACGTGISLNAAGDIVAVGSGLSDGGGGASAFRGHVRVFQWNGTAWTQLGADINGVGDGDFAAYQISLDDDGNTLAIASGGNDNANGQNAGHVRVFEWNGTAWTLKGNEILGLNGGENAGSGVALSNDGSTLVVGAQNNGTNGGASGQVRVYDLILNTWTQRGAGINGLGGSSFFGSEVDINFNGTIIAGSEPFLGAGTVRILKWQGGAWVQIEQIAGENNGDQYGDALSMDDRGSTIAIGGYSNDDAGNGAGHVRVHAGGSLDLEIKVFLQGPLSGGLMNDNLRANGDIPTNDPYGLNATINPSVLMATGNDAIVDWVQVELRDVSDDTKSRKTIAALVQRDGDVVALDGVSTLQLCDLIAGGYRVAVRHRNHLGVMSNLAFTPQNP